MATKKYSHTLKTTIEREVDGDFIELPIEVEFDYDGGSPGCWYRSNGDPGDPPEPAWLEVTRVEACGVEIALTTDETERVESACWDQVGGMDGLDTDASDRDYDERD